MDKEKTMTKSAWDWTIAHGLDQPKTSQQYHTVVSSVRELIRDHRGATSAFLAKYVVKNLVDDHGFKPVGTDNAWDADSPEAFPNKVDLEAVVRSMILKAAGDIMEQDYGVAPLIVGALISNYSMVPRDAHSV